MNETLARRNRTVLGGQAIKAQLYISAEMWYLDKHTRVYCFNRVFMTFLKGVFVLSVYYKDTKIIRRSSGRTATSAAAYRAGQMLRAAAYRSGTELAEGEIVYDYRNKGGVVHSEIFLPKGAPPEYTDRETLWNAVEKSEKRKDAQLAREIIVALQREFDLQESIEVLRDYIKNNFVSKGMIADLNIHDESGHNPHAHIMLTTRHVSPAGFGKKNRDWNKKELLLEWRKSWANINNDMFERKGLAERIDHRSYKEQGLDKEPMIHLGHEVAALEKKGIKTERGDYNRAVQQRNAKRIALREAKHVELQSQEGLQITQDTKELQPQQQDIAQMARSIREIQQMLGRIIEPAETGADGDAEAAPSGVLAKLKTATCMEERQKKPGAPSKTASMSKERPERPNILKRAKYMKKIRAKCIDEIKAINGMKMDLNDHYLRAESLPAFIEGMDERARNIGVMSENIKQMQTRRRRMFFGRKRREKFDMAIRNAGRKIRDAIHDLKKNYNVTPKDVEAEKVRILKQIADNKAQIEKKEALLSNRLDKLEALRREYCEQERMVKIPSKYSLPAFPETDPKIGRWNAAEILNYLSKRHEVKKRREKDLEKSRLEKPQKILMISEPEQEKTRLADVIGRKACQFDKPVRLGVSPRKRARTIG